MATNKNIPSDLIPADLVPVPNDLVPASEAPAPSGPSLSADRSSSTAPLSKEQNAAYDQAYYKRENENLRPGERLANVIKKDVVGSLTPNLISAAIKPFVPELALPQLNGVEKAADAGIVGNLAAGALTMGVDPVGNKLMSVVGQGITKVPGVRRIFSSADDLIRARSDAMYEMEAFGDVVENVYKQANRAYIMNRLARNAIKFGAEIGSYEGASELASQLSGSHDFSPFAIAERTLIGAGLGSVLGGGVGALASEAERFAAAAPGSIERIGQKVKSAFEAPGALGAQLEAQKVALQTEKAAIQTKLKEAFELADGKQKVALREELGRVTKQIELLKSKQPAIAGIDRAAARTAIVDKELEEFSKAREAALAEIKQIKTVKASLRKGTVYGSDAKARVRELEVQLQSINSKIPKSQPSSVRDSIKKELQSLRSANNYTWAEFSAPDRGRIQALEKQVTALDGKIAKTQGTLAAKSEKAVPLFQQQKAKLDVLNEKLQQLEDQKFQLEWGLESPYVGVGAKAGNFQTGLQAIDAQIAELELTKNEALLNVKAFLKGSGPISVKQQIQKGWVTRPEFLDKAVDFADWQASELVKKGAIKEEQKNGFAVQIFQDIVQRKKLPVGGKVPAGIASKTLRNFTQTIELNNLIDKRRGTRMVDSIYGLVEGQTKLEHWKVQEAVPGLQLIKSLEARGLKGAEITRALQYVETSETGIPYFNPNPVSSKSLTRPAYAGAVPSDQMMTAFPELTGLRTELDRIHGLATEAGRREIGYVNGYIPLISKSDSAVPSALRTGSVSSIENPSVYRERLAGEWNPNIHESNPYKLHQSYVNMVMKDRAYSEVLPSVYAELNKLSLLGGSAAEQDVFIDSVRNALGIDKKQLANEFAQNLIARNEGAVRSMIQAAGAPESTFEEVLQVAKQMQYEALVLRPKALLLQALQPELVGSAELGAKQIGKARKMLARSEWQNFAKQFDQVLVGADAGVLEELKPVEGSSKIVNGVSKLVAFPTKVTGIKKAYSALETQNRRVAFLGGYMQAKDAVAAGGPEALNGVLDGLLEGEKSRVIRALSEQGPEAAAQVYGIIRSYRTNFIFSAINKPAFFREGLGAMVPFTSWSQNQLARLVTDATRVGSGSGAQLARRIALPLVGAGAFAAISGYNIPGMHPLADTSRALSFELFPAISSTLKKTQEHGLAAGANEAAKFVPGVSQGISMKKAYEKTYDPIGAILGIKKDPERDPVKRAIPEYLRNLVK